MASFSYKNPNKLFWWIVFPAGLVVALIAQLVSTTCGLGLTSDSLLFLEGAEFFNGGLTGRIADQAVFQAKPPLFSLFLAVFSIKFLPSIYTLLLLANLYLLARIVIEIFPSNYWQVVTFLAVALFTPFIMVHAYLWTEPLFLIFFYSAIFLLLRSSQTGFTAQLLVILSALALLMILTRHVGLFLVIGIFIAVALEAKGGWLKGLIILMPAVLIFSGWNFGLMTDGIAGRLDTLVSPFAGGTWSRLQNFQYFFATASTWLLPNSINEGLRLILFAGVLLFLGYQFRQKMPQPIKLLLIVSLTYYLLMHTSFLIDPSSADRYLVPIYPLMAMVFFYSIMQALKDKAVWLKYLVVLWLLYPAARTIKNSIFWREKICQENKGLLTDLIQDNSLINKER